MCGITGLWDRSQQSEHTKLSDTVQRMTGALRHRGPDDEGIWVDEAAGIALGHRRLSIIDLSPLGHQPMCSDSGRYILTFNGEIYNYQTLRPLLDAHGYRFKGQSDTEVMLAAFTEWGLEGALQQFNGMFAFALWDRQEHRLTLARDRLGEKPLYYGWAGATFLFGSELKALTAYPAFQAEIDRNALALYLRHSYVPTPYTIYQGIYKLPPATYMTIQFDSPASNTAPIQYWSVQTAVDNGLAHPFSGSQSEAIQELDSLLRDAIKLRMVADVPLGAFLSGGIDSSTVVALMQVQSAHPVKTFTIGFSEKRYDESENARLVARHLGTDHIDLQVTPEQAMAVIPQLPNFYDEPFSDSSQIPTFLVSQLARQHVTVSLSGDGGDELFGGYNRYFWGRNLWRGMGWMPMPVKNAFAGGLRLLSVENWDYLFTTLGAVLPSRLKQRNPGNKLHKLADSLTFDTTQDMYIQLVSQWKNPLELIPGATELPTPLNQPDLIPASIRDLTQKMMYLDAVMYLPDDILVKLDRASMAVSLESRVPLLDHRLVEFAWRIPIDMKIRGSQGKWLLRQVLYQYVPPTLIERPKMGFAIPIDEWLRKPLRDWAEALLSENRLNAHGLNPTPIQAKWKEHLLGTRNWNAQLWDILMFQAWVDVNKAPTKISGSGH